MGFLGGLNGYVLAALLSLVAIGAAGYTGWHERGKLADAEITALKADAGRRVAEAQAQAAKVSEKVVIRYKDRIVKIREIPEDVKHDVEVIRQSDCRLPPEFLRIYNASTGSQNLPAIGADDTASCADAAEAIAANNRNATENAAQLEALQQWADGVSK